jgi:hypothetical protein
VCTGQLPVSVLLQASAYETLLVEEGCPSGRRS